jgi:hypothetical protein
MLVLIKELYYDARPTKSQDCYFAILLLYKVQMLLKFFTTQHHSLFSNGRLGKLVEEEEKRENNGGGPVLWSST